MTEPTRPGDDDLALSRLIDGALPDDDARRLRRRLADEPALAERLEALQLADEAARAAYGPIADEPLPAAVTELLGRRGSGDPSPGAPIPFARPERAQRTSRVVQAVTAVAALAAGFLLAVVVLPRGAATTLPGLLGRDGRLPPGSAVHGAFQTAASGERTSIGDGWDATPRLSYLTTEGAPCRRVDFDRDDERLASVACRVEGEWRTRLVAFADRAAPRGGAFEPASDGGPSELDRLIDATIDGEPLDLTAERALIDAGWIRGGD